MLQLLLQLQSSLKAYGLTSAFCQESGVVFASPSDFFRLFTAVWTEYAEIMLFSLKNSNNGFSIGF